MFLFNRALLAKADVEVPPVVLEPQDIHGAASRVHPAWALSTAPVAPPHARVRVIVRRPVPTTPPASGVLDEEAASSPLVRALTDYERHLVFHDQQGRGYAEGARARATSVRECAEAIQVQCQAMAAALGNLKDHARALSRSHDKFQGAFQEQQASQAKLLESTDADLDHLATIQLHKALRSQGRATLRDCVPVDKLQRWSKQCGLSHAALRKKASSLVELVQGMSAGVDEQLGEAPLAPVRKHVLVLRCRSCSQATHPTHHVQAESKRVQQAVERATQLEETQAKTASVLAKDREQGEAQIHETASHLPTSASQSTDVLNACRILEQLHQHHQATEIPDMRRTDKELSQCQRTVAEVQTALTQRLVARLRVVSELQSQIRYQGNRLAMLKENAVAQEAAVGELLHVRCMPSAYAACIEEVKLRQQYFRAYVAKVRAL